MTVMDYKKAKYILEKEIMTEEEIRDLYDDESNVIEALEYMEAIKVAIDAINACINK